VKVQLQMKMIFNNEIDSEQLMQQNILLLFDNNNGYHLQNY